MASDKEDDKSVEFLLKTMEEFGVATSSVSDGTIFMFKRTYLQEMLDKNPDNKEFVIFVKQKAFTN